MRAILILFLISCQVVKGQTFDVSASLPKVSQTGFYRIPLSPEMISHLSEGFTNLRIYDSLQLEVPYLIKEEVPVFTTRKFVEYPVIEKSNKDLFTQIIFSNKKRKAISNVTLVIKNAETTKEATLQGSEDGATWYALKENFYLSSIQAANQTYEMRILDFPLSNYSTFKLKINDSTSAPLNILRVGYYESDLVAGNYTQLPQPQLSVTEDRSNKKSIVKIVFNTVMLIDKLEFEIKAPALFNRSAVIQHPVAFITKKGKEVTQNEYVQSVQLISTQQSSFHLPSVVSKELIVEISNEDNPPLQIASVRAYQLNRYLITWLEKQKVYEIRIGKADMTAPSYDIGYFKDSVPNDAPTLGPGKVTVVQPKPTSSKSNWFSDKRFIWAAIVVVAAVLGLMSYQMVKEAKEG
jgi:hypothetical protein